MPVEKTINIFHCSHKTGVRGGDRTQCGGRRETWGRGVRGECALCSFSFFKVQIKII